MIKIIICDDDSFTVKLMNELLTKAVQISKTEAKVVCLASSGADVLNFIRGDKGPFLYFLDFDLGKNELNGIDLVKKIYQHDPDGKVIFVTSHGEKGLSILQSGIQAFGFIEKSPNQQLMISDCVKYLKMAGAANAPCEDAAMLSCK